VGTEPPIRGAAEVSKEEPERWRTRRRLLGPFPAEDRAKAFSGLALALLTVLATVVAGLHGDANSRAARGKRIADRMAVEAAGLEAASQLRAGTEYAIWERWFEQTQRISAGVEAAQSDPEAPQASVLVALVNADQAIGEWLMTRSELLQAPYNDPAVFPADFAAHRADHLVRPVVLAQQRQKVEDAVAVRWDARATDYVTVLVLIAAALFFIGLGSQLKEPARWFLAGSGLALGVVSAVWAAALAWTQIPARPTRWCSRSPIRLPRTRAPP
jgi:hypothetical protein